VKISFLRPARDVTGFAASHQARSVPFSEVRIFGEGFAVRASIHTLGGFSAHADQHALLAWTAGVHKPRARTFVVHGEAAAAEEIVCVLHMFYDVKPPVNIVTRN